MTEWLGTKARIGHGKEPLGCSQIRRADGTLPAMMIGGTWAISGQKICDMLGIED